MLQDTSIEDMRRLSGKTVNKGKFEHEHLIGKYTIYLGKLAHSHGIAGLKGTTRGH